MNLRFYPILILKINGPAVYVQSEDKQIPIYFFDIVELNGIKVLYSSTMRILEAHGNLKRKVHLPQKGDKIVIKQDDELITKKVETLKLHSRSIGLSRGLIIIDDSGDHISLSQITDIKRKFNDKLFDKYRFMKLYTDYMGYDK